MHGEHGSEHERQAVLTVSASLSEAEIAQLQKAIAALFGEGVDLVTKQRDTLVGGFTLQIDDEIYDASIDNKLQEIKARLLRERWIPQKDDLAPLKSVSAFLKKRLGVIGREELSQVVEFGTVSSAADGVVIIQGLSGVLYGELLEFSGEGFGIAIELDTEQVGAVLLTDESSVKVGAKVRGTGRVMQVPVSHKAVGRVFNPLGQPLDGLPWNALRTRAIEQPAPSIIDRQGVSRPLETGLLAIDSMIPIGRGQRELIIGDRQTGKTTVAIDAIINQRGKNVVCVYCAIGQKASTVAQVVETLRAAGAMEYTLVVASTASDGAAMQYIAPYSACAMAEDFMIHGRDVLIVYDDLSKHAVAYRAMSLLLHRPPGREAYPGDVFYLHSRLLERAAYLSAELGGGSMTALPIIETMAGDISAYIPTNVISITDGQIFLESELFRSGIRPAVNVGLSVSRVGRAAQHKAMRGVSGSLRIDLAQYRELAIFAQFGSDIDASTKKRLTRGERLTEMLKQNKSQPLPLSHQVALLLAFSVNALDNVPVAQVRPFCRDLLAEMQTHSTHALDDIDRTADLADDVKAELLRVIGRFAERFGRAEEAGGAEGEGTATEGQSDEQSQ